MGSVSVCKVSGRVSTGEPWPRPRLRARPAAGHSEPHGGGSRMTVKASERGVPHTAAGVSAVRGFVLRFLAVFVLLEVLVTLVLWKETWFAPYASANARAAAALLAPFLD